MRPHAGNPTSNFVQECWLLRSWAFHFAFLLPCCCEDVLVWERGIARLGRQIGRWGPSVSSQHVGLELNHSFSSSSFRVKD